MTSGVFSAENSLLGSENTARDDLEKLNSVKRNVQKFLENNLAPPVFSDGNEAKNKFNIFFV